MKYAIRLTLLTASCGFIITSMSAIAMDMTAGSDTIQETSTDMTKNKRVFSTDHLTDLQKKVTLQGGTERPFKNEYWDNKEEGIYVDIIDGTPLFSSLDKYESGTGWPSYTFGACFHRWPEGSWGASILHEFSLITIRCQG